MPREHEWSPLQQLRTFLLILLRKMGLVAAAWVVVYFLSLPFRVDGSMLMLFAPMIGGLAGVAIGWHFAEGACEDAGFTGVFLWMLLIGCAWSSIWISEGVLYLAFHRGMNFGGWMLLTSAMLMAFASAIWRSSADE